MAVHVTKSLLPKEEDFLDLVRGMFSSHMLTNNGPLAQKLERELEKCLHLPHISLCANGTLALQLAIRILGLNGKKVIVTPFTYVATVSALLWENCVPVFADIDAQSLCIDPKQVERALDENPDAGAIMAVHVYGNACDVASLEVIAKNRNIPIIYDGAHAFGSKLHGKSLLGYGDASTCSFHATKLFHTVEGGCVIAQGAEQMEKLKLLRAFGHIGDDYQCLGINAKLSELHAAMGICLLPQLEANLHSRACLSQLYDEELGVEANPLLCKPVLAPGLEWNHGYYPVIFSRAEDLFRVMAHLQKEDIFPRRYFYPSLSQLPYLPGHSCPVSEDIASRVLCLPFWADMPLEILHKTARIVRFALEQP